MALTRKKKIIIAVSAVAVLALVVIISVFASRKEEAEVTTVKIEVRPELRQTVTASGEVRPVRYIKLTSEVQGRIEEIYVNPGDQVVRGKPLVRIDPTQLQSNQEAQWAAAQASLNDVQSARNAVSQHNRVWWLPKPQSHRRDSSWLLYRIQLSARRSISTQLSANSNGMPT
jgi:HlyD family secretion protein